MPEIGRDLAMIADDLTRGDHKRLALFQLDRHAAFECPSAYLWAGKIDEYRQRLFQRGCRRTCQTDGFAVFRLSAVRHVDPHRIEARVDHSLDDNLLI